MNKRLLLGIMIVGLSLTGCGVEKEEINVNDMFTNQDEKEVIEEQRNNNKAAEEDSSLELDYYGGSGISADNIIGDNEIKNESVVNSVTNTENENNTEVKEVKEDKTEEVKERLVNVAMINEIGFVNSLPGLNIGNQLVMIPCKDLGKSIGLAYKDSANNWVVADKIVSYDTNLSVLIIKVNDKVEGRVGIAYKTSDEQSRILYLNNNKADVAEPEQYNSISDGIMLNKFGEVTGLKIDNQELTIDRIERFMVSCEQKEIDGVVYKGLSGVTGNEALSNEDVISLVTE